MRCISASQIAKSYKLQTKDVTALMEQKGYVRDDKIIEAGRLKGLMLKNYMGHDYIAYPENLPELNELVK